jgi:hypothetical protein
MRQFRAFVSYSSSERDTAEGIVSILEKSGLNVFWDRNLGPGESFPDEIRARISTSHVFVVVLGPSAESRAWLQQEVGYAIGVGVPIIPIVVGDLAPMAFLQPLQAIHITTSVSDASQVLSTNALAKRIEAAGKAGRASFESVYEPEARAQTIARYARAASERGGGRVLELAAMSTFALPDEPPDAPIWQQRDGNVQRSRFLHIQQYEERITLGDLARQFGCSLILDPYVPLTKYGPDARRIRLQTLLAFIRDENACPDLRIAIRPRNDAVSFVIVDDWFCAESVTPMDGSGYRHTLFTSHAPTVLNRVSELEAALKKRETTRSDAALLIESEISAIGAGAG